MPVGYRLPSPNHEGSGFRNTDASSYKGLDARPASSSRAGAEILPLRCVKHFRAPARRLRDCVRGQELKHLLPHPINIGKDPGGPAPSRRLS